MAESKDNGRIVYIEPNNIPALRNATYAAGVTPDNITWNPEDLNISVDIQVIIPTREHRENVDYEKNALFNPKHSSYKSFFSGVDMNGTGMLSDDYTNVSYEEIRINGAGSRENLGVNSINIKFDANLYPVVTMKFTDVRASSLMAPAEQAFLDKQLKSEQVCRNFFSALFRFPYPLFNLTVKGVYGTRVTFRLSVTDFKSNYNPDTGNFDVIVTFIGNIYGLYTDIPFRCLLVAPYIGVNGGTEIGEMTNDYWKRETSAGGRFFYNEHGKSAGKIITYLDYVRNYREALSGSDGAAYEGEEGIAGLTEIEMKKQRYNGVLSAYKSFIGGKCSLETSIEGAIYRLDARNNEEDFVFFFDKGVNTCKIKSEKSEQLIKEAEIIRKNCEDIGLPIPDIVQKIANLKGQTEPQLTLDGPLVDGNGALTEKGKKLGNGMSDTLKSFNDENLQGKTIKGASTLHISEKLIESIDKAVDELSKDSDKLKEKASQEMLDRFKRSIGFEPTVENAFRMLFAHIDTFLHYFYRCIDDIPLTRKIKDFSIKIEDTDVDSPAQNDAFLPPFTAFYRESRTNGGEPERYYPGDNGSSTALREIHEVKLVEDIFNGINSLAEVAKQIEENFPGQEESDATPVETEPDKASFTMNPEKFKPICLTDIFYEGRNPYNLLTAGWEDPEHLLYFVMERIYALQRSGDAAITGAYNYENKRLTEDEINNLSKSNIWPKIVDNAEKYNNPGVTLNSLMSLASHHPYKITKVGEAVKSVEGESFFWDSSNNGFQNFFDLNSKYDSASITSFCGALRDSKTDLSVHVQKKAQPKTYARPIPLSEAIDTNGDKVTVPFYDPNDEEHTVLKTVASNTDAEKEDIEIKFNFVYEPDKYNVVTESEYGAKVVTKSDFNLEAYSNMKEHKLRTWIPFVPNFSGEDANNKNYFFSGTFWTDSGDMYFHAAKFLGGLLGTATDLNFTDRFIRKIPKYHYLAYCALAYAHVNQEDSKYLAELNRFDANGVNNDFISQISSPDYNKEVTWLSEYYKKWVDSIYKGIQTSLKTERDGKKIIAKTSRDKKGIFQWAYSLSNNEVRIFNPNGEFMNKLMNFYWETATPIYIKYHPWASATSNGGYSGSGIAMEPFKISDLVRNLYFSKLYNKVKDIKKLNSSTGQTNEDDSPSILSSNGQVDYSKTSTAQRNSLYYTLKNLYDRWISTYSINQFMLNSPEKEEEIKRKRFVGTNDANGFSEKEDESEFNSFLFVDKFYNDISKKFIFNPAKLGTLLEKELDSTTSHSIISFISEFCKDNKLLFRCLPVKNSLYNLESIEEMFTPMSPYSGKNRMGLGVGNTYLIMYTYEPSHRLALNNDKKEGVGYKNDGFDIADVTGEITDEAKKLLNGSYDPDELRLNVCAFGVTPNAQNQSYFTSVKVGMDNPRVTEQSIKNTLELANLGKRGGVSVGNGAGQDIYSIYSNRSYDCRVDMLGCMNILPMMYFQLNNLPMFRGAYMITSVEHNIQNNMMTTSFVGQRQSKYLVPLDADIFNVAGLSELVSNAVSNANSVNVAYTAEKVEPGTYRSFDGKTVNPVAGNMPDRTFYVGSAIKQMGYAYQKGDGTTCPAPAANKDSYHVCATAVKGFIWAGFNGYSGDKSKICTAGYSMGSLGNGYKTYTRLQELGFRVIAVQSDYYDTHTYQPARGDIAIMDHGEYGHICMWSGTNWVSDFKQNNCWPYSSARPSKNDAGILFFRYWNEAKTDRNTIKEYGK